MTALALLGEAPPPLWSAPWWSTFTTSSAFAGIAALIAALVAWVGVRNRIKADRDIEARKLTAAEESALKARAGALEDARASRWWEMYQWTLARIDVLDPDRVQILLEALESQAPGDPERALVSVAGDILAPQDEPDERLGDDGF